METTRYQQPQKKTVRINTMIRAVRVRLVDDDGTMIGIVPMKEALAIAQDKGLDLVEISPDAEPPVCKITDYGRLRYRDQKKKTEMRKKQKLTVVKEVQLRPNIQEHDYNVKILTNAKNFLTKGDKVKVSLRFRGRESVFQDLGKQMMERVIQDLAEVGKPEHPVKEEGGRGGMSVVIAPRAS